MSKETARRLVFPAGFLWSAATSAHQVEGGNDNSDWWDFEARPGAIKRGERSGKACDHWNRVADDVALLKSLNLNHYRFSVEWARIEPAPGRFDAAALDHYARELSLLAAAGIKPLVTLHHFTLPRWLAAEGGWAAKGAPEAFAAYASRVYEALGAQARDWLTLNEPMVLVVAGYVSGDFPPGRRDLQEMIPPLLGLLRAHAAAYHAMRAIADREGRELRVGIAHHLRVFDPARPWLPLDWILARVLGDAFNWLIPDTLRTGKFRLRLPGIIDAAETIPGAAGTEDFIGLNYYSRDLIKFAPRHPLRFERIDRPGHWRSDLGWEIYPRGIYRILKLLAKRYPHLPVMITENGLADGDDRARAAFIREHLRYVHAAIEEGVRVEGYSHWSLLDNFEWAEGFAPRFGLCAVDYQTYAREPRPSARVYAEIARQNAVELAGDETTHRPPISPASRAATAPAGAPGTTPARTV